MGDPKKLRKKFRKPVHPWQKIRIENEKSLMKEFGLKNKKEIWKMSSVLRKFKKKVKQLIPRKDLQAEKEKKQLLEKLQSLNLLIQDAKLEDILVLTLKDILQRRLQSIVYHKGFTKSISQARQFITHEHIIVGDRKITSPSYLVSAKEEGLINFAPNSGLKNPDHPERLTPNQAPGEEQEVAA